MSQEEFQLMVATVLPAVYIQHNGYHGRDAWLPTEIAVERAIELVKEIEKQTEGK